MDCRRLWSILLIISDSNFYLVDRNTIVNPPIMHMTLNWCFTRVLIDTIGFNRCFIISSFNLATLQFFKKRQNRRYYHFKSSQQSLFFPRTYYYNSGSFKLHIFCKRSEFPCEQLSHSTPPYSKIGRIKAK